MDELVITATEYSGSSQIGGIVIQPQPEPQVVVIQASPPQPERIVQIVAENPIYVNSQGTKRFDKLLVEGRTEGRTTIFRVSHNLNTERPGRLVTLASGTKSEINSEITIVSLNEVEVKFGMPVPDGAYWLTLWQ